MLIVLGGTTAIVFLALFAMWVVTKIDRPRSHPTPPHPSPHRRVTRITVDYAPGTPRQVVAAVELAFRGVANKVVADFDAKEGQLGGIVSIRVDNDGLPPEVMP